MYRPTIAIVEDKQTPRHDLARIFEDPPAEWQKETGIPGFRVETARSAQGARSLLKKAEDEHRTIDVLWLDLGLPEEDHEEPDHDNDPEVGMKVLRELQESEMLNPEPPIVGNIVVGTSKGKERVLEDLIRTQIVRYFVAKPWDPKNKTPFNTAVSAYRSWQRRQWHGYEQRRLLRWATEAARVRIGNMAQDVTNGVSAALAEIRKLTAIVEETYNLNASLDRDSPVCRRSLDVRDAVAKIARDCARERESHKFFESPESFDEVTPKSSLATVSVLLESAADRVFSGLESKVIRFDRGPDIENLIDSSPHHVLMVIEEMLFGAIDASVPGGRIGAGAELSDDGWSVEISVRDDASTLTPDERNGIEEARPIEPGGGRGWGLALAQYVALNVGARLEVKPSDSGNLVTLHLPLAAPS